MRPRNLCTLCTGHWPAWSRPGFFFLATRFELFTQTQTCALCASSCFSFFLSLSPFTSYRLACFSFKLYPSVQFKNSIWIRVTRSCCAAADSKGTLLPIQTALISFQRNGARQQNWKSLIHNYLAEGWVHISHFPICSFATC